MRFVSIKSSNRDKNPVSDHYVEYFERTKLTLAIATFDTPQGVIYTTTLINEIS